jgi:hypothetical protein
MRKSIEEYLDFAECFPTAIAEAMGNNWKAEDIRKVIKELRLLTLIGDPLTTDWPHHIPMESLPPSFKKDN